MHSFEESVAANFLSATELNAGQGVKILLALSGGPDSVSLLLALKAGLPQSDLHACHVNHGLRGEASSEEQFCLELCRRLSVPLTVINLDLDPLRASEDRLRQLRYQALLNQAVKQVIPYVVTGHTLDDQLETMLFRLCRGTSIHGLSGMKAARALSDNVSLVRPLLAMERKDVENFLRQTDNRACFDQSNADSKFTRNFLRLNVIPLLLERFPNLVGNFERLRILCHQDNQLLDALAREQLSGHRRDRLTTAAFESMHPALRGRVITQMMGECGVEPSFERVERALLALAKGIDTRLSIGDGFDLSIENSCIRLAASADLDAGDYQTECVRLSLQEIIVAIPAAGRSKNIVVPWLDKILRIVGLEEKEIASEEGLDSQRRAHQPELFPHRQALDALMDLSQVDGAVCFRARRDGDVICPLGMAVPVRLKQYLHANKDSNVPAQHLLLGLNGPLSQRLTPVLADEKEILWVPGYGLSEKVRVKLKATHGIALVELVRDSLNSFDYC